MAVMNTMDSPTATCVEDSPIGVSMDSSMNTCHAIECMITSIEAFILGNPNIQSDGAVPINNTEVGLKSMSTQLSNRLNTIHSRLVSIQDSLSF